VTEVALEGRDEVGEGRSLLATSLSSFYWPGMIGEIVSDEKEKRG
jgi:hypothetical protein